MGEHLSAKNDVMKERQVEQEALNAYNESMKGKVQMQNHEHNARKEGFARKEEHWNN